MNSGTVSLSWKESKMTAQTQKVRITAKEDNAKRYSVDFMGVKVAVAFDRDSGAKVGRNGVRMVSGEITSGGSRANWYCLVKAGSVFELEVDAEFYNKNKNRIKKWHIEEIEDFSISKERSDALMKMEANLE
jgi:hypothetical protein